MKKTRIAAGLTILSSFFLAASITTMNVMEYYRDPIDEFTDSQSSTIITDKNESSTTDYNFKSNFTSAKEAFEGYKNFALKEAEETNVLLKNENNTLPLSGEKPKVTLFGLRSHALIYGNNGGSTPDYNTVKDNLASDVFDKYFDVNKDLQNFYKDYTKDMTFGSAGYGAKSPSYAELTNKNGEKVFEISADQIKGHLGDTKTYGQTGIVVLGREGGEQFNYYKQNFKGKTSTGNVFGLTEEEKSVIKLAKETCDKVIVLINSTQVMEFKELTVDPEIDAIMWIGYPGPYGLHKVCETLLGKVNPSGHLGDTFPTNGAASPAMQSFGNIPWLNVNDFNKDANVNSYLIEAEGIYSGYRYYETRYADTVLKKGNATTAKAGQYTASDYSLATTDGTWNYNHEVNYPFGYGLSYTTFKQTLDSVEIKGDKETAIVKVSVENTGSVAGKSVIQLYAQTPYTDYDIKNSVEKSAIQLLDFEKTSLLQPKQKVQVTMTVDLENLASYDYKNAKTYIADAGTYYLSLGESAHDALNNVLTAQGMTTNDGMDKNGDKSKVYSWNWDTFDNKTFSVSDTGVAITNRLSDGDSSMDLNSFDGYENKVTYLTRNDWASSFPKAYEGLSATGRLATLLGNDFIDLKTDDDVSEFIWGAKNGLTLNDLKGADWNDPRWNDLIDQVTISEFLNFAGNAFHNIAPIESVGYVGNKADDGPGGSDSYTLESGQFEGKKWSDGEEYKGYGTRVAPSQQNLAYTFNKELAFENGQIIIGETSLIFNLPIIIGPGMNLHRHGYNGRGGEYYSEDPILSGFIGSASVQGAQSKGVLVNLKHAAFNDQEVNRSGIAVFMNEQKARELELRNLQQAFEGKGKPASFEGIEEYKETYKVGAYGVMTSYNRIGATASSANKGVMVDIMRNEWGFKGYNVTDFTGISLKAAPKESILYGTTAFCGFGGAQGSVAEYWKEDVLKKDATMSKAIKQNIKYILYSLANSNALNGINSSSRKVELMTSWRATYIALLTIFSATTLASIIAYLTFAVKEGKRE